jgi:hypothetical protein
LGRDAGIAAAIRLGAVVAWHYVFVTLLVVLTLLAVLVRKSVSGTG